MGVPPPPPPGPPPPGPPPPPMGGLKSASGMGGSKLGGGMVGGDGRGALLQSIQMGTKLKKTVTVDKSAPAISGKVSTRSNAGNVAQSNPVKSSNNGGMTNGGNAKLGGIFEGMSSMPKLKPVSGRGTSTTPTNRSPPSEPSETTNSNYNCNGPALDFNAELTKHLTLKKQKKQEQSGNPTEANLRTNRGPPPQPPAQKPAESIAKGKSSPPAIPPPPLQQNESNSSALFRQHSNSHSTSLSPTTNGLSNSSNTVIAPNKSSLFGSMSTTSNTSIDRESNSSINSLNNSRPVPNHGKPNCAPKPPGIQQIIAAKSSNNGSSNNGTGRPTVARHHSMKTPRSPPVSLPGGPVFPTNQHFGTMRGAPQQFQSQDAINQYSRPAPSVPIGRPTVAPPRPPNIKPPPPPTPIRSISNTNLTNLPLSLPPNDVNTNSNFGSASNVSNVSNVSTLKRQMKHQIGTGSVNDVSSMHNANNSNSISNIGSNNNLGTQTEKSANNGPPLPPHRTCPAPQPPVRQNSNSLSSTTPAPVPPQRHSSIRNSTVSHTTVTMQSSTITSSTKQVNRLIIDLEKKFSQNFHNVTEFRAPGPFTNLPKSYPSRNVKSVNAEIRKPQAPSPPVKQQNHYLELGDANANNNTTTYC